MRRASVQFPLQRRVAGVFRKTERFGLPARRRDLIKFSADLPCRSASTLDASQ
jgi:hypothetical protein